MPYILIDMRNAPSVADVYSEWHKERDDAVTAAESHGLKRGEYIIARYTEDAQWIS